MLFLTLGSLFLLIYATYHPAENKQGPVKCSGKCLEKSNAPVQWNIVSPTFFQLES
jgi:hypothetical protein